MSDARRPSTLHPRTDWFRDLGFGMFIHWGPYSVLGRGEWAIHDERIPPEEYDEITRRFTASKFDARAWVELAKAAGMKYIVLTTCHGDGYCLFGTKACARNSVDMTPKRDLVREYVEACREGGLGVGFYYGMTTWYENAKRFGTFDIRSNPLENPARREGWKSLMAMKYALLRDILSNYGPIDILWLDDLPHVGESYDAEGMYRMVREFQPNCMLGENTRGCGNGDFDIAEERFLDSPPERPWELCMPIAVRWGYHRGDTDYKSIRHILSLLRRCASGRGNLLLNTGPYEDGRMQPEQEKILRTVGAWLKQQGQSVFGCKSVFPGHAEWGDAASTDGKYLYLHVDRWMGEQWACGGLQNQVRSATLLSTGEPVAFEQQAPNRIIFSGLPLDPPDPNCNVFAIETEGKPDLHPWME